MQDYFIYLYFYCTKWPFGSIYIFFSSFLYRYKIRTKMFPLSLHSGHEVTPGFLWVASPSELGDKASETAFIADKNTCRGTPCALFGDRHWGFRSALPRPHGHTSCDQRRSSKKWRQTAEYYRLKCTTQWAGWGYDWHSLEPGENRWCYDIGLVLRRLFSTNVHLSVQLAVTTASVWGEAAHSGNLPSVIQDSCRRSISGKHY